MLKIGAAIAGVLASVVLAAPAHGAMLAFVTTREGDREIYLMDDAGGSLFNVTDDFSEDYDPAWAPDGGRLVFTRDVGLDADIMVIGVDGKGEDQLTVEPGSDSQPAFSPDGARIAFVSAREGGPEVWVMNADGSGQRRVTATGGHAAHPAWSPDGARIAFARADTGDVRTVSPDGGADTPLGAGAAPAWAPDGAHLAMTRGPDLWRMGADGGAAAALITGTGRTTEPAWSSDGRIAFTSDRDGDPEIYAMNADGTGVRRLTTSPGADTSPVWQPPAAAAGIAGAPGAAAPAASGTITAGSGTAPGSRTPTRGVKPASGVRLDLRHARLRVYRRHIELTLPVWANRPTVGTIELRRGGHLVTRFLRPLLRGTTTVRWQRRIGSQRAWRGRYTVAVRLAPAGP